MMFNAARLRVFVDHATKANTSYYSERRTLFREFTDAMQVDGDVEVSDQLVVQIKLYLQSRNNLITNDGRLAFEVGVLKLMELVNP